MLWSRAEYSIVTITREVVTLTKLARHNFLRVESLQAFTLATDAVTSVVAQSAGGIIWSTSGFQIATEVQVVRAAFTLASKVVRSTLANSTHVSSMIGTVGRILFIALK